jgi:hypothetical protein
MTGPITRHRGIESLKTAARWPGADQATTVILATRLAAARADAEGYRYFCELAGARPGEALPLALAGFFQARLGEDADAALARLDQAAATDLGLPQYFRGLALAGVAAGRTLAPVTRQPGPVTTSASRPAGPGFGQPAWAAT